MAEGKRGLDITDGPIGRATGTVYRYLALGLYLVVTCLPTVVVWTFLVRDRSNAVLYWWALLPVAPALAGALFALRAWASGPDPDPGRQLWRGLKLNVVDVLKWWVAVLLVGTVPVINIAFYDVVPGGDLLRAVSVVVLAVLTLWACHLLVVTAWYSFRTRDSLRVAAGSAIIEWKATLGFAAILILAGAVVYFWSEIVALLFAWALAAWFHVAAQPVATYVNERFISHE